MNIEEQLQADIKNAMRAKDKVALGALRAIKKVIIEAKSAKGSSGEVSNEDCVKIITKLAKQGKDAAQIYKEQDRSDLYDDEMAQVKIFDVYLPAQLSDEELSEAIKAIILESGATSMKEMGKVMGIASSKLAGKTEGGLISAKVKELLA